jgi:broad specificity phosphatase PhoE
LTTKKIYLIRHGQTDFNLKGIVQGRGVDTDLNDTGRSQAKAFYKAYKDVPFKKVYTSALKRTHQSVQGFIDAGIAHEAYAGLDEISWGNKDGKIANNEDHAYYWDMLNNWKEGNVGAKIIGGESPLDVQDRQRPVWDLIMSRTEEDPILVCMHGRAIRILLATVLNYPLQQMDKFEHQNLGLYILNYTGSFYSVEAYNSGVHLEGIV